MNHSSGVGQDTHWGPLRRLMPSNGSSAQSSGSSSSSGGAVRRSPKVCSDCFFGGRKLLPRKTQRALLQSVRSLSQHTSVGLGRRFAIRRTRIMLFATEPLARSSRHGSKQQRYPPQGPGDLSCEHKCQQKSAERQKLEMSVVYRDRPWK